MENINLLDDKAYMQRAIQLAALGRGLVSPNPMVGAVIVHSSGRIIGEGYHHRFGGPHAEVCAVDSVKDKSLLKESTIYVTLEPCSHYGKTPPCAKLLIDCGIPRVVVGMADPNPQVAGRGIAMLREAGTEVIVGVLEQECRALNPHFITAYTLHRPYILLKWAQSADGYLAKLSASGTPMPVAFSTAVTSQYVHALRADFDAIMVGSNTVIVDNPRLDTRLVAGRSPIPVIIDRHNVTPVDARVYERPSIRFTSSLTPGYESACNVVVPPDVDLLPFVMETLYAKGITSVMVEGGARLLKAFMDRGLWDEIRVETSPITLGSEGCAPIAIPPNCVELALNKPNIRYFVKQSTF